MARNQRKQLSQMGREHLKRSGRYIPPVKPRELFPTLKRLQRPLNSFLNWLQSLVLLKILTLLASLSILVGAVNYIASEGPQRNAAVYQAWQAITMAYDQPGSGGRKQALEFLNSQPKRNPRFWMNWDRESLAGVAVPKAYLQGIQLSYADLKRANLRQADLTRANLQETILLQANLQEAVLEEADLQGSLLSQANLYKANLNKANLQGASLNGANLEEADLFLANLQEVGLTGANLRKANLLGVNFQKAYLVGSNLREAKLSGANLRKAKLIGANLQEANLKRAILQEAIYTDKNTKLNICERYLGSKHSCPTIFPSGFNPKAAGMILLK